MPPSPSDDRPRPDAPAPGPARPDPAAPGRQPPDPDPAAPGDHSAEHDLLALLRAAETDLAACGADGAVLRITTLGRRALAWFPLDGAHPLDLLLRFTAPPHWQALGVSCAGWAHRLDDPGRARAESPPVTVAVLVHRVGTAVGLLRQGTTVTAMPEPPQGIVPDACRRALGLPTAPAPPTTAELWALCWLDRLVATAALEPGRRRLDGWDAVAALHPAARPLPAANDPAALAGAAAALARAWPWHRLRYEPAVLDLPGSPPDPGLGRWMDDGMWARWVFSSLPAGDDLLRAVHDLLPPAVAEAVTAVVSATCGR
ncbi:MAG TPA: hypothetical protein VFI47_01920 [Acidimicrobiales bacterium]|nr:hypothetical protein [Acidimicrobiales bacterium]